MKVDTENNFTVLRLLLATLVVLGHFKILSDPAQASGLFSYADFAVDAFFVVSGYLVYGSFERKQAVGCFFIRRFFRIYPLYFVTVVAQALAMATLAGGIAAHGPELLRYLGYNLIFANFMAHDIGGLLADLPNPGINPSLWTLKVEVGFYLLLPLLWYAFRRWKLGFLLAIYALSTVYAAVALHYEAYTLAKQLPGQLRFFAVGIALYHWRHALQVNARRAALLAVILFAICTYRDDLPILPVYPVCVGLWVFLFALRLPAIPIRYDISYGVYLFHGPLIQFALLLGIFQDSWAFLLAVVACAYALAWVAERVLEQPGIELGKRLSRCWEKRDAEAAKQPS